MTLRLAVPNKGRLQQPTTNLLKQSGLSYEKTDRALAVPVRNMDLELLFVRTDDVSEFASPALAAFCLVMEDISSMDEEVSSIAAACSLVPWAND